MRGAFGDDRLMRFVLALRQSGVTDPQVLAAMELTPRAAFTPSHLAQLALDDADLPLPQGQKMTRPSLIGHMLGALDMRGGEKILEVGTGSGYQAAVLSRIASRVITIEVRQTLMVEARARLGVKRLDHVQSVLADGAQGYARSAPFDRIIINAAVSEPPAALLAQLSVDGVLCAPLIKGGSGVVCTWRRGEDGELTLTEHGQARFEPLEEGTGSLSTGCDSRDGEA